MGTIISSKNVQQVGIKCYVCNLVARNMYSIGILLNFSVGFCTGLQKDVLAVFSNFTQSCFRKLRGAPVAATKMYKTLNIQQGSDD